MKKNFEIVVLTIILGLAGLTKTIASPLITTDFIKTDQFGYRTNDQKIAVISDPVIGFNASLGFTPGTDYEIRDWSTDAVIFAGNIVAWNNGEIHDQSGDKVWYFDFSQVTDIGSYYVFDVANNVGSYKFEINDCVYNEVLKQACRANYYQRCGSSKVMPHAEAPWTDAACHIGAHQDLDCRLWSDTGNISLSRDLSGGWHDAGDFNL
jgi:endoglucanase